MMIGGDEEIVDRLDPIFDTLAPGLGDIARTPGREGRDARAEQGYIHAGPAGAGHFVKMVHNGIEYGLMQAYAEGFDILKSKASEPARGGALRPRPAGHRRGLAARQRHLLVAARPDRRGARQGPASSTVSRAASPTAARAAGRSKPRSRRRCRPTSCRRRSSPAFAPREHTFGDKLLSAMRFGFGGHVEAPR